MTSIYPSDEHPDDSLNNPSLAFATWSLANPGNSSKAPLGRVPMGFGVILFPVWILLMLWGLCEATWDTMRSKASHGGGE